MKITNKKTAALLILMLVSGLSSSLFSQNAHSYFWDSGFEIEISSKSPWSYSFAIGNRRLIAEKEEGITLADNENEHIELEHYTQYQTSEKAAFSLGLKYRFREAFNDKLYNEFRIVEQFNYANPDSHLNFSHRARFEQRFRVVETIFRLRYQLGISRPLGESFSLGASTEALYAVSAQGGPEAEQRLGLELTNTSFGNLELELGLEYRVEDYIRELGNEFFIFTGATLNL